VKNALTLILSIRIVGGGTTVRGEGTKTFKETLQDVCTARHDDWAREVDTRLAGALMICMQQMVDTTQTVTRTSVYLGQ